jgi:hypothetical protein
LVDPWPEALHTQDCPADRIDSVLRAARDRIFVGLVNDEEAVNLAVRMGLVRVVYEGASGFMGLGKLEIAR